MPQIAELNIKAKEADVEGSSRHRGELGADECVSQAWNVTHTSWRLEWEFYDGFH